MHQITVGSTQLFKEFKALFRAAAWENVCKCVDIQAPWTTWRPCSEHWRWEWGFRRRFHCSVSGYGLGFQVSAGCHRVFHAPWLQNTSTKFWYCFWVSVWNSQNVWKLPNKIIELKQKQSMLPLAVRKTSALVSLSVNTCTVSSIQLTPQHATTAWAKVHWKMKLYLPQLLRCFPLFRGDVVTVKKNKHEACHSGQDVDREMQARTGLLFVEKGCGSFRWKQQ